MPAARRLPIDQMLTALSAGERGFVLGAALLGDSTVGPEGLVADEAQHCRPVWAALQRLPTDERAVTLDVWCARASDPLPAGLAEVHADWLRQALMPVSTVVLRSATAGLPATVVAVVDAIARERGESGDGDKPPTPLDRDTLAAVRRALFVDIVSVDHEPTTDAPRLESLIATGAETLGVSLRGAPRPVIARAAAQVGQPAAQRLLDAAARAGSAAERQTARERVAAVRPQDTRLGAAAAIGVYQLAETLVDEADDAVVGFAQRLPLPVGSLLLDAIARLRARR